MRTIIINTMGSELPQYRLFFLPFREDQIHWIDRELERIDACAEDIDTLLRDQDQHRDYRMVVLVDLSGYEGVDREMEKTHVRKCYQQLIQAHINGSLLRKLAQQYHIPPADVTTIFLMTRGVKGTGGTGKDQTLDYVFGWDHCELPVERLKLERVLSSGGKDCLDLTPLFADALGIHRRDLEEKPLRQEEAAPEQPKQPPLNRQIEKERAGLLPADLRVGAQEVKFTQEDLKIRRNAHIQSLRKMVRDRLDKLQVFSYLPAGEDKEKTIPTHVEEFLPRSSRPQIVWADLQLNLSEYIALQVTDPYERFPKLELRAHTEQELAFLVEQAALRLDVLAYEAPGQKYYRLESSGRLDYHGQTGEIWQALQSQQEPLPGVEEAKNQPDEEDRVWTLPQRKLKGAWLRADREKQRFYALCDHLEGEYNQENASEQQKKVLDICAGQYRTWRRQALRGSGMLPEKPLADEQPEPDTDTGRSRLEKARQECAQATADSLAAYKDLRRQAEEVKAKFRKTQRLWPGESPEGSRYFIIYSVVFAAVFLLQMLLPYMGITMGQKGVELSRYVHFLLSLAVFAGLYLLGVLIWLWMYCRKLRDHGDEMEQLIWESGMRRRESIKAAVKVYGELLPRCMVLQEEQRELQHIHKENKNRRERYMIHVNYLRKARELLRELNTMLRLPASEIRPETPPVPERLDYEKPCSAPENLRYYMLMSEEWGDKAC